MIFLETIPLNFNEDIKEEESDEDSASEKLKKPKKSLWSVISNQILDPQKGM